MNMEEKNMDRKHLMELIRFSENPKEADEVIRRKSGFDGAWEKCAFLKGMFDCLESLDITSPAEECYQKYLQVILANGRVEEVLKITQRFRVRVSYKKRNRHKTRIFSVLLEVNGEMEEYGTLYYRKEWVEFKPVTDNQFCKLLDEEIIKAYPAHRLQRIYEKQVKK